MSERTALLHLSDRRLRSLAYAGAAVFLLVAVAAYVVHRVIDDRADVATQYLGNLVVGGLWPLAGAAVIRAEPRNRCGWLLIAMGAVGVYELFGQYSLWSAKIETLPGHAFTDWTSMFGFTAYFFAIPLLPLLFPDGHAPGRRWSLFARAIVIMATVGVVGRMLIPGISDIDDSVRNPIQVDAFYGFNFAVFISAYFCLFIGTTGAIIALLRRTRRAVGVERAQLLWLLLGGIFLLTGMLGSQIFRGQDEGSMLFSIGLIGPPLGVAVAIVRHRLFDVEFALSRTLVLIAVVGVVGSVWATVFLTLDPEIAGSRRGVALVAALAILAVAVRAVVQRWVDRWWFPHRQGSTTLAPRIAAAVSLSPEPREALAELVTALRTELRLPYAAFRGVATVSDGLPPARIETIEATALGRDVGVLEVAPRRQNEGFTKDERRLLEQVAAQAAVIAYAASLVGDVEKSRSRIVRAREEERRRLRNDLHDGVGPSLAGIALQMDALAGRLDRSGDDEASAQAQAIRDRIRETVTDVRSVSHGLRPPILDQIGLAEALRQLVRGLGTIEGVVQIDDLRGLSAASEVATYVIAAEAVTNVVKHSAASRVRIDVEHDHELLRMRVSDNGRGMPTRPQPGVGVGSMRSRAAELGGRLDHRNVAGGGTLVELVLPFDDPITREESAP